MIPKVSITQWRRHAPWIMDEQIEQDLILSRIKDATRHIHSILIKQLLGDPWKNEGKLLELFG